MKRIVFFLCICFLFSLQMSAQGWLERAGQRVKDRVVQKVENRVDQKVEEATDKVLDKAEGSVKKSGKQNQKGQKDAEEAAESDENQDEDAVTNSSNKQKLESVTAYDFVPGDEILFFEDFSQDAIGDFPALWTSNGSGEVKKVSIAPGNWFHMNGEDAV